jgi:hypothetical protein
MKSTKNTKALETLTILVGNAHSRGEFLKIESCAGGPFLYGIGRKPALIAAGRHEERGFEFSIRVYPEGDFTVHPMNVKLKEAREIEGLMAEILA